jgi:hypothetical protein
MMEQFVMICIINVLCFLVEHPIVTIIALSNTTAFHTAIIL